LLTTSIGSIFFNATTDSYSSWHDGLLYLKGSDGVSLNDDETCTSQILSGVYEGEVPYGQDTCQVLVELDHAPSGRALPPHILVHLLSCAAPADKRRKARPPATVSSVASTPATPPPPAWPLRRLLQAASGSAGAVPAILTLANMSAPDTVFIASNSSRDALATFRSVPALKADVWTGEQYVLIFAPHSVALGAFRAFPCIAC
jgi:hypothetical protein